MRQLNKWQTIVYLIGGILMVVGAGCYAMLFFMPIASLVYMVGAVAFVAMQSLQRYDGNQLTIRRLRRIMGCAELCFLLAGVLMLEQMFGLIGRQLSGATYDTFVSYTYNKWVVLLLIAALLEIYTMHRISSELNS